jgi:hypothetical protein
MSQPVKTATPSLGTKALHDAAASVNANGTELDAVAAKIVAMLGLPSFRQALAGQPELRDLEPMRVVDLISATLAETLFTGATVEEDVLIELDGQFVAVPADKRELLLSAVTRALAASTAEVAKILQAES